MKYRKDRYGNNISVLGYGCMRFTREAGKINLKKAEHEIMVAVKHGVNYFDTAYVYPGSEAALGEIVYRNNIRDRINIATKLPHYMIKSKEDAQKYFEEELKRLKTDHIDYYLMHMLTDTDTFERLCKLGIKDWISEKKENGSIRQIGFSYHGNSEMFIKLLDAYDWDFCQIQYNYLDEFSQAGRKGLEYAYSKNIPVIIMEPLRGGKLVNNLPEKAKSLFRSYEKQYTPAQWALKWLWNQPGVTCVLSGMNSYEMVKENIITASKSRTGELTEKDEEFIKKVVEAINEKVKIPCTGCRYCMPCPKHVDIPGCFSAYNRKYTDGYFTALREYFMCTSLRSNSTGASNCVECGRCERHCPQHIEIRKNLKKTSRELETPVFRLAAKTVRHFMKY